MSATGFDTLLRIVGGALLLVVVFAGLRRSPKLAVIAWLIVICFIPTWIGVQVIAYLPAFAAIAILSAVSLLPVPAQIHTSLADLLFTAILVIVAVEALTGDTTRSASFELFTSWAAAFFLGRLVSQVVNPEWIYRTFAVFFTIVAVLALVEFVTSTNLFITYLANDTRPFDVWGGLQPRGGVLRAEGAFGHSIALGASLAIAIALTMGAAIRPWLKSAMLLVMGAAVIVTFSRIGMVAAAIGIVLACLFQREVMTRAYRAFVLILLGFAAAAAAVYVSTIFADAGDEATNSALYRSDLLSLVTNMRPIVLTGVYRVSTTGEVSVGGLGSIDNAALLFGLLYGWVPLALIGLMLVAAIVYVVRRRATPAVIAIVAQIPSFFTVALITQYAAVIWFTAGVAVTTQILANSARSMRRLVPEHEFLSDAQRRARTRTDAYSAREVPVP